MKSNLYLKLFSKPVKQGLIVFIILSITTTIYLIYLNMQGLGCISKMITIDNNRLSVCIADTAEKQKNGLSGVKKMNDNQGMLFIFDEFQNYSFWMKDMNFPLDIIWISQNHVVEISKNVPVQKGLEDKDLANYQPSVPVDKVLEVNAGWSDRKILRIGDKIEL